MRCMARALRIDLAGAWYHVMNRGYRVAASFLDNTDRRRFLAAVAELPERCGQAMWTELASLRHSSVQCQLCRCDPIGVPLDPIGVPLATG